MTDPATDAPADQGLALGPVPDDMPPPDIAPPQVARPGDPFGALRIVHFLARVPRNRTLQLRDVVTALNAAFLDWSFSEKAVLAEVVQLQANWGISFHGEDRIILDRNERGHTLLVVDSQKMTAFLVGEARRLAAACEDQLRSFSLREGASPDW
ncbi:MAG: hypothetical protein DLM71_05870 [Chloroflexi bacterium]|nr:MAG: hypothetical protein DLM71_05870 [Chloroflexota bacterium]